VLTPNVRWRPAARIAWQLALLLVILLAVLALRPGQVSGLSMEPRIDSDEYVLINALAYRFATPARGEIVAFRHERSAPTVYLKRHTGRSRRDRAWERFGERYAPRRTLRPLSRRAELPANRRAAGRVLRPG
jgi:signal peptidase I